VQPPQSELILKLAKLGQIKRFRKGTVLMHEGEPGHSLCIVLEGSVRVFISNELGKELTLGVHGPGEFIGEMSLDGGLRSANVEAPESCQCSFVPLATVREFLVSEPEFSWLLITKLIGRLRATTLTSKSVALMDVYSRLRSLFFSLAVPTEQANIHAINDLTQLEISRHLACSREMVSKLLSDLEAGGYVKTSRAKIQLLKPLPARW
jgi:CRP/FNR family transcriptional regulator, cyclic AMP receptor protein